MSVERLDRIEKALDTLADTTRNLETVQREVKVEIKKNDSELRVHIATLHKDLASRIAALPDNRMAIEAATDVTVPSKPRNRTV